MTKFKMTKFKTLSLLTTVVFFLAGTSALAQQAAPTAQNENIKISRTTHEQHVLADVVAARIRAGLRGQPYSLEQSCDGDDCVISIHR